MSDLAQAYFIAPTASREGMQTVGIIPDDDIDAGEIWLYDTEELALRRAQIAREQFIDTPEGNADVWLVDLAGIAAELHPQVNDGENVTVDVDTIAADRLTLTATL